MSNVAIPIRGVPEPVVTRLRSLRRRVGTWLLLDGLSIWLWWLVGLCALDLLVDWYFRMDWSQRACSLGLIGLALVIVAYRRLVRPLGRSLDDDALCLRVEARHRALGERLISAVQFSRDYDAGSRGVSAMMVEATIDEGTRAAKGVDFGAVLDGRKFVRNLALTAAAASIVAAAGVSIALTEPMRIWFNRNVLLGSLEWPQNTYLELVGVDEGKLLLPKGDDWDQVAKVVRDSEVPDIVYLDYKPRSWGSQVTEQMVKLGDGQFHTLFKNVLEEFEFRVRGGDAQSRWISVKLTERPAVERLELRIVPPAYTRLRPETLPPGKGPYDVLKGSKLEISGTATKDLVEASVRIGDRSPMPATIRDRRRFSVTIEPGDLAAQTYGIELVDTEKWSSKRPARFSLRIKPDREPSIKARLEGIGAIVVPGARLPITFTLSDDFAVSDARLVYQVSGESAEQASRSGELHLDAIADQFGQKKITSQVVFETEPLSLDVGSLLTFHLEAKDNDDVSGPKTGKSEERAIKVVSEEELRAELLRREKEQRQEVERVLKDQEELWTRTQEILARVETKPEMPDDERQELIKAQRKQSLAGDRCNLVANQLTQIIAEVRNNRLEEADGPIERRLTDYVIEPLRALAAGPIPHAAGTLDTARRATRDPAARDQALADAAEQQHEIGTALREVLKYMAKSEGYQEAVNLLYAILKSQNELNDNTIKEAQQRIRELFEDKKDKPVKPGPPKTPDSGPTSPP